MSKERPAIFVSYRRQHDGDFAGRLADRLIQRFGRKRVFYDLGGGIGAGQDFAATITDAVAKCHVLISVIGPHWLSILDERDDASDWVHLENATALERNVHVIPIRLAGAQMPSPEQLPDNLKRLSLMNGPKFDLEDFDKDANALILDLEEILKEKGVKLPMPATTRRGFLAAAGVCGLLAVGGGALAMGSRQPTLLFAFDILWAYPFSEYNKISLRQTVLTRTNKKDEIVLATADREPGRGCYVFLDANYSNRATTHPEWKTLDRQRRSEDGGVLARCIQTALQVHGDWSEEVRSEVLQTLKQREPKIIYVHSLDAQAARGALRVCTFVSEEGSNASSGADQELDQPLTHFPLRETP